MANTAQTNNNNHDKKKLQKYNHVLKIAGTPRLNSDRKIAKRNYNNILASHLIKFDDAAEC